MRNVMLFKKGEFMKKVIILFVMMATILGCAAQAPIVTKKNVTPTSVETYSVRMFFGLSIPNGGAVSLYDWETFEKEQISRTFEGYNIVDSIGYYKGKPEHSKIGTFIVKKKDIPKIKELARAYAHQFQQESVMIVLVPVLEWSFIEAGK